MSKSWRQVGLAWQNALELMRVGRLSEPYRHVYEVKHADRVYRLRHYAPRVSSTGAHAIATGPLLLVPPLMVSAEIYDVASDVSAVGLLARSGVDTWVVDFGVPEKEEGGLARTLDDHVCAVSDAIDRVREASGRDVHLAGYSQGGMFCYQTAAFRKSAGIASILTFGSPVDLHRTVPVGGRAAERIADGMATALAWPLARLEALPGFITATGFKLLSARKEAQALIEFVTNLHDRDALAKREAKRMFLRGEGFVAWPGPAFRKFFDEMIVANRLVSGGLIIDGHAVSLADVTCPILFVVGLRDEMGKPRAVRAIRNAAPKASVHELIVNAGHFGLVVGQTAQRKVWPTAVQWLAFAERRGPLPPDVSGAKEEAALANENLSSLDNAIDDLQFDLSLASDVVGTTAHTLFEQATKASAGLGRTVDQLRFQLPRLARLRTLTDDEPISFSRALMRRAKRTPDQTFFLWRDRAFTYAQVNARVDAIVAGLIGAGVRSGVRVGVVMASRPTLLSLVAALSRMSAIAVLFSPESPPQQWSAGLVAGAPDIMICDPEHAHSVRRAFGGKVLLLGGASARHTFDRERDSREAIATTAGASASEVPVGVTDLESVDPTSVVLPSWYVPDQARARDLAIVFVSSGRHTPPKASRITNRRWAFSALGAAAACSLAERDTVYNCLPLHHPSGLLVATGAALVSGARLAMASQFAPSTFWDEVRRYGASLVFYCGEMCRDLVDAQPLRDDAQNPVRLFAGSGMAPDTWAELTERFGVDVLEFYASTEASVVLANTRGRKQGSIGKPLPGSAEVAIVAWDASRQDFARDVSGRLIPVRANEVGMLIARLDSVRGRLGPGADVAHVDPKRVVRDVFTSGDTWFATGDFVRVDAEGDFWHVGRVGELIATPLESLSPLRLEAAAYTMTAVRLCAAISAEGLPALALQLIPGRDVSADELQRAFAELPAHAKPARIAIVPALPVSDGRRLLRRAVQPAAWAWRYIAGAARYERVM